MDFCFLYCHLYAVPSAEMYVLFHVKITLIPSILLLGHLQRHEFIFLFYQLFFLCALKQEYSFRGLF